MALIKTPSLDGRRVLITGAARGIGAALAERLHQRGARVAVAGLEARPARGGRRGGGGAPWRGCDVPTATRSRPRSRRVEELGGLDVVVANAGVAAQLPLIGGDPRSWSGRCEVNVVGVYYTLRAAGPHISHPGGYALRRRLAGRRRPRPAAGRL